MENPELKSELQEHFFGKHEGAMKELIKRLNEIPDAYFDFVVGIAAYASNTPLLAYAERCAESVWHQRRRSAGTGSTHVELWMYFSAAYEK